MSAHGDNHASMLNDMESATINMATPPSSATDAAVHAEQPAIIMTPQLAKNTALVIARAEMFQVTGKPGIGRQLLMEAINQGGWKKSKLWWRLVAMMSSIEDYRAIHDLWLRSPSTCHASPSILRAIARAAAVSGHHHDCRTLLRKLILLLSARNRPASAPMRMARKLQTINGLTRHQKSAPVSPMEFADQASIALTDLNQAFSEIGLKAFLISGTLLGQVREGKIIGWDKDIDVGYFTEDCKIDLESHFVKSENFRLGRVDFTSDRLRLIHQNGTWIDVFPHYMEDGRRWHNGTATRWWNTPFGLRTVNFIGIEQYIPDNPERYLDENYGNWRIPNANFDARIDAPNTEISDPEHFISLLYFSLEKNIREGKDFMKKRYIELLRAQGEGTWLDKL